MIYNAICPLSDHHPALQLVRRKHGQETCKNLATAINPEGIIPGTKQSGLKQPPSKKAAQATVAKGKAAKKAAAAPSETPAFNRAPTPPSRPSTPPAETKVVEVS